MQTQSMQSFREHRRLKSSEMFINKIKLHRRGDTLSGMISNDKTESLKIKKK